MVVQCERREMEKKTNLDENISLSQAFRINTILYLTWHYVDVPLKLLVKESTDTAATFMDTDTK